MCWQAQQPKMRTNCLELPRLYSCPFKNGMPFNTLAQQILFPLSRKLKAEGLQDSWLQLKHHTHRRETTGNFLDPVGFVCRSSISVPLLSTRKTKVALFNMCKFCLIRLMMEINVFRKCNDAFWYPIRTGSHSLGLMPQTHWICFTKWRQGGWQFKDWGIVGLIFNQKQRNVETKTQ